MEKYRYSQLPVFDKNHSIGNINEKKITELIISEDLSQIINRKVKDLMEDSFPRISTISILLRDNSAVLVTKKDKTVGIITKSDLFKVAKL